MTSHCVVNSGPQLLGPIDPPASILLCPKQLGVQVYTTILSCCFCFDSSHPSGCELVSLGGCDLHFPNDLTRVVNHASWPFAHVLWRKIPVHSLDHFFFVGLNSYCVIEMCPCVISNHFTDTWRANIFTLSVVFFSLYWLCTLVQGSFKVNFDFGSYMTRWP